MNKREELEAAIRLAKEGLRDIEIRLELRSAQLAGEAMIAEALEKGAPCPASKLN